MTDLVEAIVPYLVALGKLVLAGACGAAVGWEREAHEKAAGLRTHVLLAIGACLYALTAVGLRADYPATDIMRVIQGALMGTGFICAGVIFREGRNVRGLTTAAGLWVMGATGVAVGLGHYYLAVVTTALTVIAMTVLKRGETKIRSRIRHGEPAAGGTEAPSTQEDRRE
jgi:putative Mg2+ transporter-C (MgtC) family protein